MKNQEFDKNLKVLEGTNPAFAASISVLVESSTKSDQVAKDLSEKLTKVEDESSVLTDKLEVSEKSVVDLTSKLETAKTEEVNRSEKLKTAEEKILELTDNILGFDALKEENAKLREQNEKGIKGHLIVEGSFKSKAKGTKGKEFAFKTGNIKFNDGGTIHESKEALKNPELMERLISIGSGLIEEVKAEA